MALVAHACLDQGTAHRWLQRSARSLSSGPGLAHSSNSAAVLLGRLDDAAIQPAAERVRHPARTLARTGAVAVLHALFISRIRSAQNCVWLEKLLRTLPGFVPRSEEHTSELQSRVD